MRWRNMQQRSGRKGQEVTDLEEEVDEVQAVVVRREMQGRPAVVLTEWGGGQGKARVRY